MKGIRVSLGDSNLQFTTAILSLVVLVVECVLLISGTKKCGFMNGHALEIGGFLCFVHGGIIVVHYIPTIVAGRRGEVSSVANRHGSTS
uniref:Uncharacterized protein n=1 Tax=Leersia perrieri TaxID=77586 RepID=A0A0D9VBV1_9ORYZ